MSKNFVYKAAKTLLIPALIVTGLTACGMNNTNYGTRTSSYDTRTANYTGYDYNAPGFNNGFGIGNYGGYRVNHYGGYSTKNLGGYGPTAGGVAPNDYRADRPSTYSANNPNQRLASKVVNLADTVPGVTRATAVVQGNNIVVGIDVDSNGANADQRTLDKQVAYVIQKQMPGYSVYVTSDGPMHNRIQNIYRSLSIGTSNALNNTFSAKGTTPGHPVRDLGSDIANIIRDIGRTVTAPLR